MELKRYKGNPILKPDKIWWRSKAIFNCAVEKFEGKIVMLMRCAREYEDYISRIGFASSKNGIDFKQKLSPVIKPDKKFNKWGCEDPRLTKIKDTYFIPYVALSKPASKGGGPPRVALVSTKDFKRYKSYGIITPKGADVRDAVIFPEKINGKYVMLHRPFNWTKKDIIKSKGEVFIQVKEKIIKWPRDIKLPKYFPKKPSIWICYSEDLKKWEGHEVLMEPKYNWESVKIGGGTQPIKTEQGWLIIYHGVGKNGKYYVGAALLDINTLKEISRTKKPLLGPEKKYEKEGYAKNIVFPSGVVLVKDKLFVYYGAADTYCCLATIKLSDLLKELK